MSMIMPPSFFHASRQRRAWASESPSPPLPTLPAAPSSAAATPFSLAQSSKQSTRQPLSAHSARPVALRFYVNGVLMHRAPLAADRSSSGSGCGSGRAVASPFAGLSVGSVGGALRIGGDHRASECRARGVSLAELRFWSLALDAEDEVEDNADGDACVEPAVQDVKAQAEHKAQTEAKAEADSTSDAGKRKQAQKQIPARIERAMLRRARGDEAGLLSCYPLSQPYYYGHAAVFRDIGPRRNHGWFDRFGAFSAARHVQARGDMRAWLARQQREQHGPGHQEACEASAAEAHASSASDTAATSVSVSAAEEAEHRLSIVANQRTLAPSIALRIGASTGAWLRVANTLGASNGLHLNRYSVAYRFRLTAPLPPQVCGRFHEFSLTFRV